MTNADGSIRFPTSEELSKATVSQLRNCGLGFRAEYIKHAAEYCTNNMDLEQLGRKDYPLLKDSLMEIHGIGDKVADCIALMGYGRLEAFPIDVWVKRTMEKAYFGGKPKKIAEIHDFATEQWVLPRIRTTIYFPSRHAPVIYVRVGVGCIKNL